MLRNRGSARLLETGVFVGLAICVYCSSSSAVDHAYRDAARELGTLIGRRGHSLVYGGSDRGLMGVLSTAAKVSGARVVGVLPKALEGVANRDLDEIVLTNDLRDRKAEMQRRSGAFVALPGGFGTLDELAEILTQRQLGFHTRPVALVNVQGFFDPLLGFFERFYELRFAKPEYRALCYNAPDPEAALRHVEEGRTPDLPAKWFA